MVDGCGLVRMTRLSLVCDTATGNTTRIIIMNVINVSVAFGELHVARAISEL